MEDAKELKRCAESVNAAFELLQAQRRLMASTVVGSPAHRSAAEVLALIEEGHFLLSETHRMLSGARIVAPQRPVAAEATAARSRPSSRFRRSLAIIIVFAAVIGAAAVLLEIVDPAPIGLQAENLEMTLSGPSPLPRRNGTMPTGR